MRPKKKITSGKSSAIIKKMVEDKKAVNAFIRGEKSMKQLHDKGIKFADPLKSF